MKNKEAIDYAINSCETMMRKFKAEDLPPKGHFHYHQGVFLSGMYKTYLLSKDERFLQYIKDWIDSVIDEDGNIISHHPEWLDDIQPGVLLFPLIEKFNDSRYEKALKTLMPYIYNFPINEYGAFWHRYEAKNQMWLDGLYMVGPISVEYGAKYNKPEYIDLSIKQALLMCEHMKDNETGLLYHAWDSSKSSEWADLETGLSEEFWGRSIGWVGVAILDELDYIEKSHPKYEELCKFLEDLLKSICKYQGKNGLWYQVVNKFEEEGNWPEISCSSLFVAALCKAVRKGVLGKEFLEIAKKGYEAIINDLTWEGEDLLVGNVCIGTGVCTYQGYCDRPVATNDLHGVGAFLLMCQEVQQVLF